MEDSPPNKKISWAVFAIIGGIILLFGIWKLISSSSTSSSKKYDLRLTNSDWVKGNKRAKIVLIEYSDFQCPACSVYSPIINQLSQKLDDKIALVYRHFPLSQHKNAAKAAYAAEAAGKQEKFWEMHDLLFEKQDEWAKKVNVEETFTQYAQSLNLDLDKFRNDFDSKEIKEKVNNDYLSGQQVNVTYTPTFYLNGEKITNPQSLKEFEKIIDEKLNKL